MLTHLIFFLCLSDNILGLQMEMNLLLHSWAIATCHGIFSSVLFLESRGRAEGKEELRELMVASQSSPSMSDSNHLMPLEAEQSVVIFLLFILPLQPGKIKKVKLQLWRAFLPSFFVLLSSYLTVLLSCSGTVTLYSIQGVSGNPKWQKIIQRKKSPKRQLKEVVKPTEKQQKGSNGVGLIAVVVCVLWKYQ